MRVASSPFSAALVWVWAAAVACSEEAPRPRAVSLEPRGTQAVLALGLADRLVAVDAVSRSDALAALPTATIETALAHRPDLILIPPPERGREAAVEALRDSGALVLEVAPHQFDEAFALYREIAAALGEEARGRTTARRIGDPLAEISTRSLGQRRPLVAGLVSLDPLVLAGGHSFVSDLIEVAGAETLTHAAEVARVPARVEEIRAARPELVVAMLPALPAPAVQAAVRSWFDPVPVAFLAIDSDALWLEGAVRAAQEIHALVEDRRRVARSGPMRTPSSSAATPARGAR